MIKRALSLTLTVLLASPFSFIALAEDDYSMEVGHWWEYSMHFYIESTEFRGDARAEVEGTGTKLGHDVYLVSMKGKGLLVGTDSSSWELTRTMYMNTTDGGLVFEEYSMITKIEYGGQIYTEGIEMDIAYDPPLDMVGYRWTDMDQNYTLNSTATAEITTIYGDSQNTTMETSEVSYTMAYLGVKMVRVEAGTFSCHEFLIESSEGGYTKECTDPEAGTLISEDFAPNGQRLSVMELESHGSREDVIDVPPWIWVLVVVLIAVIVASIAFSVRMQRRTVEKEQDRLYSFLEGEEKPPKHR